MIRWNRYISVCFAALALSASVAVAEDSPEVRANSMKPIEVDAASQPETTQPLTPTAFENDAAADPEQAELPAREYRPLGSSTFDDPNPRANTGVGSLEYWLQTLFALAVVIALIFGLRWLLRKFSGQALPGSGGALVEVLARTPIGYKTQVVFLRVNERIIVAGQTPAGINTLAQFDEPEDVAAVLQQVTASRSGSISGGFAKVLGQHQTDGDDAELGGDDDEHRVDRARDGMSSLINRIRRLREDDDK